LRPWRSRERYARKQLKSAENNLFHHKIILVKGFYQHKNLQYFKERPSVIILKTLKRPDKYIACSPAGVVQHRLLAGSCRPLRVLLISASCLLIISYKYPAKSINISIRYFKSIRRIEPKCTFAKKSRFWFEYYISIKIYSPISASRIFIRSVY